MNNAISPKIVVVGVLSAALANPIPAPLLASSIVWGQSEPRSPVSDRAEDPPADGGKDRKDEGLAVAQIALPKADRDATDFQIQSVATDQGGRAQVGQLPGDLEIPEDDDSTPELAISQPHASPERALYGRVAEAWQLIRQRGQQPTPELIAREIGPDSLARFLDQNPAASDIFGRDSNTLPVDVPEVEQLPGGGILLIPPEGG